MPPSRLYGPKTFISEGRNEPAQKIGAGHKIGVEQGNESALRQRQPILQGARLVSFPVRTAKMYDPHAPGRSGRNTTGNKARRIVRRIVEHLYFEPISRIIELRTGVEQPFDDKRFVENRQLDRDERPGERRIARRIGRCIRDQATRACGTLAQPQQVGAVQGQYGNRYCIQKRHARCGCVDDGTATNWMWRLGKCRQRYRRALRWRLLPRRKNRTDRTRTRRKSYVEKLPVPPRGPYSVWKR